MAQLFGFEFKRTGVKQEEDIGSFAPVIDDEGSMVVAEGGVYGTYVDLEGSTRTDAELITRYRRMALQPECELAIDDIVNETIVYGEEHKIVEMNLDSINTSPKMKEVMSLKSKQETASNKDKEEINAEIIKIDSQVKIFQKEFKKEYSDIFFTKVIKATSALEMPEFPESLVTNQEKGLFQYNYNINHYLDNVDFTDGRMLKTPIFFNKMDTYLNKLTIQHPDSISKSADVIVILSNSFICLLISAIFPSYPSAFVGSKRLFKFPLSSPIRLSIFLTSVCDIPRIPFFPSASLICFL